MQYVLPNNAWVGGSTAKKENFYRLHENVTEEELFVTLQSVDTHFPMHQHQKIELVWVLSGEVQVCLERETVELQKSDMVIVAPGDQHGYRAFEENELLMMQFSVPMENSEIRLNMLGLNTSIVRTSELDSYEKFYRLLKKILIEYRKRRKGYQLAIQSYFYQILLIIMREVPDNIVTFQKKKKSARHQEMVEAVLEYFELHYEDNISLDKISKAMGFSKFHFAHLFKEATGTNFVEYLSRYRLEKAKLYLIEAKKTITEVANQCGYQNITTFNRIFKKYIGVTPSQYRKMAIS